MGILEERLTDPRPDPHGTRAPAGPRGGGGGRPRQRRGARLRLLAAPGRQVPRPPPGRPREFQDILDRQVVPRLGPLFPGQPTTGCSRPWSLGCPKCRPKRPSARGTASPASTSPSSRPSASSASASPSPARPWMTRGALKRRSDSPSWTGLEGHLVSLDGTSLERPCGRAASGARLDPGHGRVLHGRPPRPEGGLRARRVPLLPGRHHGLRQRRQGAPPRSAFRGARTPRRRERGDGARHGARRAGPLQCRLRALHHGRSRVPTAAPRTSPWAPSGSRAAPPRASGRGKISFPMDRDSVMVMSAHTALFMLWSRLARSPNP